jgi:hypothetical protein
MTGTLPNGSEENTICLDFQIFPQNRLFIYYLRAFVVLELEKNNFQGRKIIQFFVHVFVWILPALLYLYSLYLLTST